MASPRGSERRPSVLELTAASKGSNMARPISPQSETSRGSFSSVRENDDGLAQTFTRSKISSYSDVPEEVFDESPSIEPSHITFRPPVTQPNSRLHGFWFPADGFKGWREIPLKGKLASRSFEDLHRLSMTWESPPRVFEKPKEAYPASKSPLERLPSEVLGSIIDMLFVELPPNGLTTRNADLMSLLLTSRSLHAATLTTLYRHVTIPHSRIFRKFLATISTYPSLATIVRRLDFSHFNPSMFFTTASERAQARNLTSETLVHCLQLMPYLQEFLAQEYIDDDLSADVLRQLFFNSPELRGLDFCGCSCASFKNSFISLLEDEWPEQLSVTRLSFHKCLSLPSAVFSTILPRLPQLTHLDVAGTRITDEALLSIPQSARLTHLNLAKCKDLSADAVLEFIANHPAAKSLVFLSLATDASNHLLLGKFDVIQLLPKLPSTLRSLSLRGCRMEAAHLPELVRLSKTLEELALGRGLTMTDIRAIFFQGQEALTHNLKFIDLSDIDTIIGSASDLLAPASAPLQVIEIAERSYERAAKSNKSLEKVGWTAKEFGSRYWIVRGNADGTTQDNGSRVWKMGADSWGMRKVPVAVAEVGGMYGSYMFGRRI
ncbi:leucine rich repeat domain protein [Trichoderma novae-zelandiae]